MVPSLISKAKTNSDPDLLSFDEAMTDTDQIEQWREAPAQKELQSLEKVNTWTEVPIHTVKHHTVLPGTWVFKCKRIPDNTIKKHKARYCVQGDLQQGENSKCLPLLWYLSAQFICFLSSC